MFELKCARGKLIAIRTALRKNATLFIDSSSDYSNCKLCTEVVGGGLI